MKIVSGFKQPYDGLLRQSLDGHLWIRKHLKPEAYVPPFEIKFRIGIDRHNMVTPSSMVPNGYVFVINNKMMPVVFIRETNDTLPYNDPNRNKIIAGYAGFTETMRSSFIKADKLHKWDIETLHAFFAQRDKVIDLDTPVALLDTGDKYDTYEIQKNPILPEALFSLIQPYEMYHQVMYWFNNRSNPEKPMVQVSNDVRVQQHGFDKMSFRKRPGS